MTLGDVIKEYRQKHRISMEQFSKSSGLSKAYIGILEKNINPTTGRPVAPSIETYKQVAKAMGLDLNNLIDTVGDDSPIDLGVSASPETAILSKFRKLNDSGKAKLINYADDLLQIDQYREGKTPLTIAARGGDVIDASQVNADALIEGLKDLDPIDNL